MKRKKKKNIQTNVSLILSIVWKIHSFCEPKIKRFIMPKFKLISIQNSCRKSLYVYEKHNRRKTALSLLQTLKFYISLHEIHFTSLQKCHAENHIKPFFAERLPWENDFPLGFEISQAAHLLNLTCLTCLQKYVCTVHCLKPFSSSLFTYFKVRYSYMVLFRASFTHCFMTLSYGPLLSGECETSFVSESI